MTASVAADRDLPRISEDECSKLSVVLAFPVGTVLSRKQLLDIVESATGIEHVVAAAQLRHPSDWCVTFDSIREKNKLLKQKMLQTKDGMRIRLKDVGTNELCGKLLWLPPQIPLKSTKDALSKYGKVTGIVHDIEEVDGRNYITGPRSFFIELNAGLDAENVPHILEVEGFEALVIIRGRKPLCTICNIVGHIAKSCPERKNKLINPQKKKRKKKSKAKNKKDIVEAAVPNMNCLDSSKSLTPQLVIDDTVVSEEEEVVGPEKGPSPSFAPATSRNLCSTPVQPACEANKPPSDLSLQMDVLTDALKQLKELSPWFEMKVNRLPTSRRNKSDIFEMIRVIAPNYLGKSNIEKDEQKHILENIIQPIDPDLARKIQEGLRIHDKFKDIFFAMHPDFTR